MFNYGWYFVSICGGGLTMNDNIYVWPLSQFKGKESYYGYTVAYVFVEIYQLNKIGVNFVSCGCILSM